jgi:Flp pilus assembly protein TadG
MRRDIRGQILPLFALMLVAIFAMTALAIDVSSAYAARQSYRTAADAASLAGAQDLQVTNSRAVTAAQYTSARQDAKASIDSQFGATSTCTLTGNRSACTFATLPYQYSIVTPLTAGACATCDPARSVQVNFGHPSFPLSFAHVLGLSSWNVGASSVAGLQFAHSYAIVTLRPPTSTSISGVRDIEVGSNAQVVVGTGDVGTNANMIYGGSSSLLSLDSGYYMYYFDPANAPLWGSNPPGVKIYGLIADPGYPVPVKGATPPVGGVDSAGCAAIAAAVQSNPNYAPSVPMAGGVPDMANITCYTKGVYSSTVTVPNGGLGIFEPGLYFFDGVPGLNAQGSVIGGYTPNSEGVAFVFRETQGTTFKNRTSGGGSSLPQVVALNAGTRYLNAGGREATAAHDYSGGLVQTNTTPAKLMTVIVPPDLNCPVTSPMAASCTNTEENQNKAIDLSGGSSLYLAGVQYAPSDAVTLAGNTAGVGYVGQVWAWTLKYTGNATINQQGDGGSGPGILRLDAACTAPGTPCVP